MTSASGIALSLLAGLGLGGIFFGGLRLTVRRLPGARHPALLALASFLARLGAVGVGLYLLAPLGWAALVAALAGILGARHVLVRRWALAGEDAWS